DPLGRAGGDQVAGQERHDARDVADEMGDPEDHLGGGRGLAPDAVDERLDRELFGLEARDDARTAWTERVESLGPRELDIRLLQIPGRDVVHAGEAEDVLESPLLRNEVCFTADHDTDLPLVVDALARSRQPDRLARGEDGRGGLEKKERLGR